VILFVSNKIADLLRNKINYASWGLQSLLTGCFELDWQKI